MSISARNWAWRVRGLITPAGHEAKLKSGEKLVLLCLAEHENAEMGYSFPSMKTIGKFTSMTERSVQTHLRSLEEGNAIKRSRRRSQKGNWLRNVYILNVPENFRANDPEWQRMNPGRDVSDE